MKILSINQTWFTDEFRSAGHEVITCGFRRDFDVRLDQPLLHIDNLIKLLPNGFVPDVLVIYDESSPLMISGFEQTDIPTLFYSVDTHHHWELHRYFAHLFDATLVAQKDYIPAFLDFGVKAEWMPLWASRFVESSEEKKFQATFVGTLDAKLNPERVTFFEQLCTKAPVQCTHGEYWKIFPHSEVVVNQTVKGDLNFRVFEAMMCGAMLLTERSANGLTELFQDEAHLVTYQKNNVEEAAERINYYLAHPQECRHIAQTGRQEILAKHLPIHRAERVMSILSELSKRQQPMKSYAAMLNFHCFARSVYEKDKGLATRALVCALKAAEQGLERQETMNIETAFHLTICALRYDGLLRGSGGIEFLHKVGEAHPEFNIIALARVRGLLNSGRRDEAQTLAARLGNEDVRAVFGTAENVISQLLDGVAG